MLFVPLRPRVAGARRFAGRWLQTALAAATALSATAPAYGAGPYPTEPVSYRALVARGAATHALLVRVTAQEHAVIVGTIEKVWSEGAVTDQVGQRRRFPLIGERQVRRRGADIVLASSDRDATEGAEYRPRVYWDAWDHWDHWPGRLRRAILLARADGAFAGRFELVEASPWNLRRLDLLHSPGGIEAALRAAPAGAVNQALADMDLGQAAARVAKERGLATPAFVLEAAARQPRMAAAVLRDHLQSASAADRAAFLSVAAEWVPAHRSAGFADDLGALLLARAGEDGVPAASAIFLREVVRSGVHIQRLAELLRSLVPWLAGHPGESARLIPAALECAVLAAEVQLPRDGDGDGDGDGGNENVLALYGATLPGPERAAFLQRLLETAPSWWDAAGVGAAALALVRGGADRALLPAVSRMPALPGWRCPTKNALLSALERDNPDLAPQIAAARCAP